MADVLIRGQGVAARCCAQLLGAAGFSVAAEDADRPRLPAILLSESTQALIASVFGQTDFLGGLPRIDQRVVAWGANAKPVAYPHSAVVISEQELTERLRPQLAAHGGRNGIQHEWTIVASRSRAASSVEHHFGSRSAVAVEVHLKGGADTACWIESLDEGWLFLIPGTRGTGWLLCVGAPPESLVAQSRMIAELVQISDRAGAEFAAHPRIVHPLCGPGWLACGTAALAFDPLCGDGTGNAVREAILAAAVIRAAAKGANVDDLLAHYQARLVAGFQRYLELCRPFYATGGSGSWWKRELGSIVEGIDWCNRELRNQPRFRYQLNGWELQAIP